MKNFLKKIDKNFFRGSLVKIYKDLYVLKKSRNWMRNYLVSINNLRQYKSLTYWNNLFHHLSINNVEGDIVECGVGNGETLSFILFNLIYNENHIKKKYIGFDSFEGFPEPSIEDTSPRNPKKGEWNFTDSAFVLSNLDALGFEKKNYNKIKFIKGFFDSSFKKEYNNIKKISLLHIDCDLYSSTDISLKTWFDKVEKNGLIVFDEYLDSIDTFPGAVKAIDEFFGEDKNKIKICPFTKKYYFIKS